VAEELEEVYDPLCSRSVESEAAKMPVAQVSNMPVTGKPD
jgi:hypothetical protein